MNSGQILITGASGFVGGHLARFLAKRGYSVFGTVRRAPPLNQEIGFEPIRAQFGESLREVLATKKFEATIHCAFDFSSTGDTMNVSGTKLWANESAELKVPKQIFISSISARDSENSSYGQQKLDLERYFAEQNQWSLRLGLVIGSGGLFGRMVQWAQLPVVPLPNNGQQKVYLIDIPTIGGVVGRILEGELQPGVFNLFHPQAIRLRDLLSEVRDRRRSKAYMLPLPIGPIGKLLEIWEGLNAPKLPFSKNNLAGLAENSELNLRSDLEGLDVEIQEPKDLIKLHIEEILSDY